LHAVKLALFIAVLYYFSRCIHAFIKLAFLYSYCSFNVRLVNSSSVNVEYKLVEMQCWIIVGYRRWYYTRGQIVV